LVLICFVSFFRYPPFTILLFDVLVFYNKCFCQIFLKYFVCRYLKFHFYYLFYVSSKAISFIVVEMFVSSKNKEIELFGVNVPLIFHRISS